MYALRSRALAALMTLTTFLPATDAANVPPAVAPVSTVTVPVSVPLPGLRAAALSAVGEVLASVGQTQTLAGGLLSVHLAGEVRRSGELTLVPDGDGLRLSLPVTAHFRATPQGLGAGLARDFSGAAVITAHVTPSVGPDYTPRLHLRADYRWTAPLSFEVVKGVSVNVQSVVDAQIRARLGGAAESLNTALQTGLHLRERATQLWNRLAGPWSLPGVPGSYAVLRPQGLSASPISFGSAAATVTLGGQFVLLAGLGQAPAPLAAAPLPPLGTVNPAAGGLHLQVPLTLAYPQLSALATRYAAAQGDGNGTYPLPLPFRPRLTVQAVTLSSPAPDRLGAAVQLQVHGLGLTVPATVDVSGTPALSGQVLTLQNVQVHTRPGTLSGRVLGWLADARVQALIAERARLDLGPELEQARLNLQAQLPYRAAPGVSVSGQVQRLQLESVRVQPQGITALASVLGRVEATVQLEQLGR